MVNLLKQLLIIKFYRPKNYYARGTTTLYICWCWCWCCCCCFVVGVVVFTLNRPFYPASSVHPVSVLIPYPRETLILWSQTVRQRKTKIIIKKNTGKFKCRASGMPAYRVREHNNTSETRKIFVFRKIIRVEFVSMLEFHYL